MSIVAPNVPVGFPSIGPLSAVISSKIASKRVFTLDSFAFGSDDFVGDSLLFCGWRLYDISVGISCGLSRSFASEDSRSFGSLSFSDSLFLSINSLSPCGKNSDNQSSIKNVGRKMLQRFDATNGDSTKRNAYIMFFIVIHALNFRKRHKRD